MVERWFGFFFFSSRRRHTRCSRDWSSDVCSSDLLTDDSGAARSQCGSHRNFVASRRTTRDRKSTRLNSSHGYISYSVLCFIKNKLFGLAWLGGLYGGVGLVVTGVLW